MELQQGHDWCGDLLVVLSRSLTCAGSPESHTFSSPLRIRPSGGLLSLCGGISGEGLWLLCLYDSVSILLVHEGWILFTPVCHWGSDLELMGTE